MKSSKYELFYKWLQRHQVDVKLMKIQIKNLPIFGNSIVACHKIQKDEIIVQIPKQIFMTVDSAVQDEFFGKWMLSKPNTNKRLIFAFYLFIEFAKGEKSKFYEYLQTLPKQYNNSIMWSKEAFQFLGRQELQLKLSLVQQKYVAEFQVLKTDLLDFLQHSSLEYYEYIKRLDQQMFLKMVSIIESRTLFYKCIHDEKSDVGVIQQLHFKAMVPFYDQCNHTFMPDVDHFKYFYFDQNHYYLKAYKNFEENEQIFITYGNYSSIHFIELYGFLPYNNQNNYITFEVQTNQIFDLIGKNIANSAILQKITLLQQMLPHLVQKHQTSKSKSNSLLNIYNIRIDADSQNYVEISWQDQILFLILTLHETDIFEFKNIQGIQSRLFELQQPINQQHQINFTHFMQNFKLYLQNLYDSHIPSRIDDQSDVQLALSYKTLEQNIISQLQF